MKTTVLMAMMGAALVATASGALVQMDLAGNAGAGLLTGNENPAVVTGGSGGEIGGGITYDTTTNLLSFNVGWGSGNGFTDLTGNATASHLHGFAGPAANAGVLLNLAGLLNASASNGGLSGSVLVGAPDEANLLAGLTYINVHTAANGGGEIRGNLVVVPEPSAALLGVAGLLVFLRRRR